MNISIKAFSLIITLSLLSIASFSQKIVKSIQLRGINDLTEHQYNVETYVAKLTKELGPQNTFSQTRLTKSDHVIHIQYQHFINNIKVEGSQIIVHQKKGIVDHVTGKLYTGALSDYPIKEPLRQLINVAVSDIGQRREEKQNHSHDTNDTNHYALMSEIEQIIIDKHYPDYSGELRHAYKIPVKNETNDFYESKYIDALSLDIIFRDNHICYHGVPSKAESFYYGEVAFTSDSVAIDSFYLRDPSRNIHVFDFVTDEYITSNDNQWFTGPINRNNSAIDLMYATTHFHDLMKDTFDWHGIDGLGSAMYGKVSIGAIDPYTNAYWNGTEAYFGNGDCTRGPYTTLNIVGHEYMHGITKATSNLYYRNESGAINESLSDIFGKLLEHHVLPESFSWPVDKTLNLYDGVEAIRSFSNPNLYGDPKYYKGKHWKAIYRDFFHKGYVHSHSGVLNHWYYLLSTGKSGTNEAGYSYEIKKIGLLETAKILWIAQTSYLANNHHYHDLSAFTVQIAKDLYGADAWQVHSIEEAWKTVGVKTVLNEIYDFSVRNDSGNRTCIEKGEILIPVQIKNLGTVALQEGSNLKLTLVDVYTRKEQHDQVILDKNILPGEEAEILIKVGELNGNSTSLDWQIVIGHDNDVYTHNNYFYFGNQYFLSDEKGKISPYYMYIPSSVCFNPLAEKIEFLIQNEFCDSIPKNTEFNFSINTYDYDLKTEESIFDSTFITEINLGPLDVHYFEILFDPPLDLSTLDTWSIHGDQTSTTDTMLHFPKLWSSNYELNTYKVIGFTPDKTPSYFTSLDHYAHNGLVSFNGDWELYSYPNANSAAHMICVDEEEYFEENFYTRLFRNDWETIVDLTHLDTPLISFDLTQYRAFEDDEKSVMTLLSWNTGSELIYGQKEGEKVHHEFMLPPNYCGFIRLQFLGKNGSSEGEISFDRDLQLLDNLYIGKEIEVIETPDEVVIEPKRLNVFPNPVLNELYIEGDSLYNSIEIWDFMGRQIIKENSALSQLNIEHLFPGVYIIILRMHNNEVYKSKFMKI